MSNAATMERKPYRPKKAIDFRMEILARLCAIGKSAYWLSNTQAVAFPGTVRNYLAGRRDTTGKVIAELMSIVGLTLCAVERPVA
jgi:hypothetical protein